MTLTFTVDNVSEYLGRLKFVQGTVAKSSAAGTGTISTGLRKINQFVVVPHAASDTTPAAIYPRVAAFPVESGDISIRAQGVVSGRWFAIGE